MLSLHTNAATLSAQSSVGRTQSQLSTSMTRLSTGYRINSAMDDAAGLQIATRLKAQTSGMAVAMRNTQNATSMMQTAEGALSEASNILVRMKDLATQAADASSNSADKTAMQSEYDALSNELTNIIGNTSFGGAKLLNSKAVGADTTVAQANLSARTADKLAASTKLGTANTYNADGTIATTGTAGSAQNYSIATQAWKDASNAGSPDPDVIAAKFQTMITTKQTMDMDADALAKATTAEAAAQAHATATTNALANDPGKFGEALKFQIGASSSETMNLDLSSQLSSMHTSLRNVSTLYNAFGSTNAGTGAELTGTATANSTVDKLQSAIDALGTVRSSLGAAANRLEHVNTNLSNISSNTQAAAGRIMDVDFATESANMTKNQMLTQAGTAMLKQSNQMSSMVMSLLQ